LAFQLNQESNTTF